MKTLITATDIKQLVVEQKNTLCIDAKTIITPSAQDAARENGIKIVIDKPFVDKGSSSNDNLNEVSLSSNINSNLVSKIVEAVISQLQGNQLPVKLMKETGENGLIQVKGSSVVLESFEADITAKEVLSLKDSPKMSAGIMELKNTPLDWVTKTDEIKYVLEGVLELVINGKKYTGKQGDIFYIPANTKVTFSTPKQTKFFYVINAK